MGKKKAMCVVQVELARSHLVMVHADLEALTEKNECAAQKIVELDEALHIARKRQLKDDVKAKSIMLIATQNKVDKKSKVLTDLEVLSTLSPNDIKELQRHR